MSFTWPAALLLGLAVPLVLATYLLTARRRRRHACLLYTSLGQPFTTLSGGERQRLKLATHMSDKGGVYVLDLSLIHI